MAIKNDLKEKLIALSTAAFGLVAALAWNSAIQQLFKQLFGEQSSLPALFAYAILVTIIAVFVTVFLSKLNKKPENNKK